MNILRHFASAFLESIEDNDKIIPFHQLEKAAVEFIKENQNMGFRNPIYMNIGLFKMMESYTVKYSVYYLNANSGQYESREKVGSFSTIKNIPLGLKTELENSGQINIKVEDILALLAEYRDDVLSPIHFTEIQGFYGFGSVKKREITIEDKLFRKLLTIQHIHTDGGRSNRKTFSFENITNMPNDIAQVFQMNGKVVFEA